MIRKHLSFTLIIITIICLFTGCLNKNNTVAKSGFFFDTVITITLYGSEKEIAPILEQCFEQCEAYENLLSRTKECSDIYKINHADGNPVIVDAATIEVLETALYYAKLSDGVVDPTIAPLSSIWNFSEQSGTDNPQIPDSIQMESLLQHVDYHTIEMNGNEVTLKDPEAQIDLGFIAKGFIADQLKSYLQSQGIEHGFINLGGNVLTIGSKPDGQPYNIGIQKPFDKQNTAMFSIPVTDQSVVSSGCYERYFYVKDTLYHHILDTSTGYPVKNNILGVTIISSSSMQGDALSTLCYALGTEKAIPLIEETPDVEAIFILNDYSVISTSGAYDLP